MKISKLFHAVSAAIILTLLISQPVAAMTDGHAESLDKAGLEDMRHWANTAHAPDWVLPRR